MWQKLNGFTPASRGGVCSVCGTEAKAREHGILATGIFIEFEGEFDICGACIKEAAALLGMVAPEFYADLESRMSELEAWAAEAYEELEAKDRAIGTLSGALAKCNGVSVPA